MNSDQETITKPTRTPVTPKNSSTWFDVSTGIGAGIVIGVALGIAMNNLAMGIALGVALVSVCAFVFSCEAQ